MSRASSPENDFVDVESTDNNRPQSAASGTSQLPSTSNMPVTPEAKRNRGRPRKLKDNPEDRMCFFLLFQPFVRLDWKFQFKFLKILDNQKYFFFNLKQNRGRNVAVEDLVRIV